MEGMWSHQRDAIQWSDDRTAVLLAHEMGCGKSRTSIEILKRRAAGHGSKILICCPKAVIAAWQKQLSLWWPEMRVVTLTKGSSAEKSKEVAAAFSDTSSVVIVVNYETAWRIDTLEKTAWSAIVWDEVHRLKSPSGAAGRWAGRVCKKNAGVVKIGLSGTMVPHSILDCYGIWRAVESPECPTFGTSATLHKMKYAIIAPGQNFVVGYKNIEDAQRKISATTHRVLAKDVLDLPKLRKIDVPVELAPQEAQIYRQIEREFCAVLDEGTITVANALVQLLRLQQICGGAVKFDEADEAEQIVAEPAKADALAAMLDDSAHDEPWVVFCRFKSDLESARRVCKSLKRSYSELRGGLNQLSDWQHAATTVLITQIQSGGVGIDLTRSRYCCFYSLGFSLVDYAQAVARLHRPGQDRETCIWHLIATIDGRSTVDGRVYEALRNRKEVVDAVLDGLNAGSSVGTR